MALQTTEDKYWFNIKKHISTLPQSTTAVGSTSVHLASLLSLLAAAAAAAAAVVVSVSPSVAGFAAAAAVVPSAWPLPAAVGPSA